MPTYGYQCDYCGHEFEQFQSITAKPLRKCPECGKLRLKRLIGTGAGIIFKGSGFYETDYRSDGYKKAVEEEKDSGKKSPEKKDAKSPTTSTDTTTKPKADADTKKKSA